MWNVKSGDLVVYVGPTQKYFAGPNKGKQCPYPLVINEIYTVEDVREFEGHLFLVLAERLNLIDPKHRPMWFIGRFRPVAKPSIESLRSLITKPPHDKARSQPPDEYEGHLPGKGQQPW